MKTEKQPEKPVLADEETKPEDAVAQSTSRRLAYKGVLAAVVVGIITITVLWMLVIRQNEIPDNATLEMEPDVQMLEGTVAKVLPATKTDPAVESIGRKLASLSGWIDRGFKAQQTNSSDVRRELTVMAESIQAIKVEIADLGKSNQELGRRISEATSRLGMIAKEVRALKAVKRKPTVQRKSRPVKTPPFQIDAIDVWDDVTYVAVSQAGRVAFLKTGEQQSGWTVTHIDRLKGQVDFQGSAGQVHSVSLQR